MHGMAQRLARLTGHPARSFGYPTPPAEFDASLVDGAVVGQSEAHGKYLLMPFLDRAVGRVGSAVGLTPSCGPSRRGS